ncbi:hypothetical protein HanPSC8_Chr02g0050321 [Helianthus annuus]|nr:hypothetical protein HanPSC8_Chr02g0050321 [Helianthus annuus]
MCFMIVCNQLFILWCSRSVSTVSLEVGTEYFQGGQLLKQVVCFGTSALLYLAACVAG